MSTAALQPRNLYESPSRDEQPEIRGLPLLGVLLRLRRDPPGFLLDCARRFGPIVPMRLGPHRAWLMGHPDALQHILRDNAANYVKTRFAEKLKPLLGNGVATSNGDTWAASRRVIHPMLKPVEIERLLGDIDAVVTTVADEWVKGGALQDLSRKSCEMTLRVIARTMLGVETSETAERVVHAIDQVQEGMSQRIWSLFSFTEKLPTAKNRAFDAAVREVLDLILETIRRRRAEPGPRDMLAALLDATDAEGRPFSDQQVLDEIMTIFVAGHETTGNTLAWTWEVIARNPEMQARLREEMMAHIPLDRTPTLQELRSLVYTQAVLQETMRLRSSAWWFARTAVADDVVMGHQVKAGDSIIVSQYITHRLEEFWPDAERFDPERFLGNKPKHKFAYIPFGGGQRTCPGGHFAMAEMSLALARVLLRLELAPATEKPRDYQALVTLRPKGGMPILVRPFRCAVWLKQSDVGGHALLDAAMRMRRRVFFETLGWPLRIDAEGREFDQFDTDDASYQLVLADGQLKASGRALPAGKPTLLYDVYPDLVEDPTAKRPKRNIWEGARLVTSPDLSASESMEWCRELLYQAVLQAMREGVTHILTVSDPVMERVLIRAGAMPKRLGPVREDANGFKTLGLRIACDFETARSLRGSDPAFSGLASMVVFGRRAEGSHVLDAMQVA
ncbi:MAG: cytochrome P450 [Rhodospirillaceae bacterium]|nr:cytochrome P450 [Rhodospirillaceae bacterium]